MSSIVSLPLSACRCCCDFRVRVVGIAISIVLVSDIVHVVAHVVVLGRVKSFVSVVVKLISIATVRVDVRAAVCL